MAMRISAVGLSVLLLTAVPAGAAEAVKIGFVGTFSGPAAVMGNDMRDAFELALDHLSRKMAGLSVNVIYEDDQQKPEVGKQKTEKLIQSDRVNFLTGYIWSNVLLASLKSAVDSETFIISANAGPSQIASELCSQWFFSTSWQAEQIPQAIGEYLNQKKVRSVFLLAPNYAAGKDVLTGFKANFKGAIVGEEYTKWPDQLDFSVELSKVRAAKPDAVFAFYPGAAGVQFVSQYIQAGLKPQIPLFTAYLVDALSLPLLKENAVGLAGAQHWVADLPNEANKRFVADFRKRYNRYPTFYAAQAYDAAFLINSAVVAAKGDLGNKPTMLAEMRKANYASVRGPYKYGNNHFPIQDFYLQEVIRDEAGNFTLKTVATALKAHQDRYHARCSMKW
jgi:branched-chain amino acid transport system substrate-binding protein